MSWIILEPILKLFKVLTLFFFYGENWLDDFLLKLISVTVLCRRGRVAGGVRGNKT